MRYVSKSDFKAARECPTKLYYRKNNYPNINQEDEFLQLLAEGGFMVGKMAQFYFPEGIEIPGGRDQEAAIAQTKEYLKRENVILFEPAIFVDGMLVRVDILIKRGKVFQPIEVKAKSIDGSECKVRSTGGIKVFWKQNKTELASEWQPYLEDVAYQTYVLQHAYTGAEIEPFLMLCDKSKQTSIDNLLQQFILRVVKDDKGDESYDIEYTGNVEAIRKDQLLIKIDVSVEVQHLLPEIKIAADEFVDSVVNGYRKIPVPLSTICKQCEYRMPKESTDNNGFLECWGSMGTAEPHMLELRYLGNIKAKGEKLADKLFAEGKASLYDIPIERLASGKQGSQQKRQIEYTKRKEEWINPDLRNLLAQHKYPLQFIDFETSRMALPYHVDMRPYGQVAFQWSCHTIEAPGNAPEHQEWINTSETYPNTEFAQTLMESLDRSGTIFMWAHHERSVLKDIEQQLQKRNKLSPELAEWLQWMQDVDVLVDQCKIAEDNYYHPDMKGSVSIKYVLPAIWNNNPYLHEVEYFKPYYKVCSGLVASPYDTLEKIEIAEKAEVIKEGSGAMRAYQEMMYGLHRGDKETHKKWTDLLRQYCALDTLAMIIIYKHWCTQVGIEF